MDIEFIVKIKDSQNPPVFKPELGKGVLQKIVVDFKGATKEDLNSNPQLIRQIYEMMNKFKDEWVEVIYKEIEPDNIIVKD